MEKDIKQQERIEALIKKKKEIKLGGGKARLEAQRKRGKMTVWERIEYFFDPGSFVEFGSFIELRNSDFGSSRNKHPGDGVVTGFGKVNGKTVYIAAQDFTVLGGSVGEMHGAKIANIIRMATQNGAPVVCLNDSGGARIQEGIGSLRAYGDIFFNNTAASGVIPQISLIMGPCAGGAVYSPGITDFVVMVENTSNMFITGPQVIKTVTSENVSMEELGGAEIHTETSGVAAESCLDDETALDWTKQLLSYLPSNNLSPAPKRKTVEEPDTELDLGSIIPSNGQKAYDIYEVINGIIDRGSFFELHKKFAKNIVIAFARIDGHTIGIVANKPKELAGCIDVNASVKAARFVRFCDSFNIPLVTLVDVPGFLPGVTEEHNGIIRHGAKLLYAYSEATVPKLTVILRKAYGGAYICMCSKHLGADSVLAWPGAEIAVMGPPGAVNIVFKKEIELSKNPEAKRKECIAHYTSKFASPEMAASLGYVDDVIHPNKTRQLLIKLLEPLLNKRVNSPKRKHGNIPL